MWCGDCVARCREYVREHAAPKGHLGFPRVGKKVLSKTEIIAVNLALRTKDTDAASHGITL